MLNRTLNVSLVVATLALGTVAVLTSGERAVAAELSVEERAAIEKHVADLGSDSAETRDAAEDALVAMGDEIRFLVEEALDSPRPKYGVARARC